MPEAIHMGKPRGLNSATELTALLAEVAKLGHTASKRDFHVGA